MDGSDRGASDDATGGMADGADSGLASLVLLLLLRYRQEGLRER
jgi:hypothetical protein